MPPSGIRIESPEFEHIAAAQSYGYRYTDWVRLRPRTQAKLLAHKRVTDKVRALLEHTAIKEAEQKRKQPRS